MHNLIPMEFKNQRIMTTKTLADSFGTEEKNVQMNFTNNQERFIEGKHFYKLEGQTLKEFKNSLPNEIREPIKFAPVLYLWTDRGAARHAKILDTDEAWEVYEKLEDTYFKVKEQSYQLKGNSLEAIRLVNNQVGMLVGTVEEIQDRVQSLENTMTIDYGQQLTLQETARHAAMMAMGGKDKPSYKNKTISSKVFAQVWRDYKEYFQINSYKNTPRLQFERAKEYISSWKPQGAILREIEECNRQISM